MSAHDDLDKQLNAYLREGPTELPDPSFDAIRDRTEHTGQRLVFGPWHLPEMNRFLAVSLGTAALVILLVLIGSTLVGPPEPAPGGQPPPSAEPSGEPSVEASVSEVVPMGEYVWVAADPPEAPLQITVTIPAPGWSLLTAFNGLMKGDDTDPPEAAMLGGSTPAAYYVYGDPCHWEDSKPDTPATTVDEVVAALAAQASRDASEPLDVMIGGYPGKKITLSVPNTAQTRGEAFADCDGGLFASYELEGSGPDGPWRWHQGPGQIDEFWFLDVDGVIVDIDVMYRLDSGDLSDTPTELIEEMRAIVESATFETP